MELFEIIVSWLNDNFRAIIAVISLSISMYFAYQKIGNRITITYQVSGGRYADTQISKLVVSNRKDKTISIWSIYAVLENDTKYEIYRPSAPLTLKSGESIGIAPEPYTSLLIDGEKIIPDFISGKIDFYVNLGKETVKSVSEKPKKDPISTYRTASKQTLLFDNQLYNENVRFILVYFSEGKKKFAYFEQNGFIGNDWGMAPNHMGQSNYTAQDILSMLDNYGYSKIFSNYVCFEQDLARREFHVVFNK
ncbi:hypothetical protein ACK32U_22345 [Aeromonas dhakensis]|uniref:hypothetical protein n=1 Tax=Aeromonas dhakensis TaxID=196024 RepID=UPI003988BF0B